MKSVIPLSLMLFLCLLARAQFKSIDQGPVFEEPERGFSKILQLKNGSTIFFHITFKEGINLKIYDAVHKQKVDKHIEPAYGKLKGGSIDGIFEINGDATLLVSETDERRDLFYTD